MLAKRTAIDAGSLALASNSAPELENVCELLQQKNGR